jgi:hypothetical protein
VYRTAVRDDILDSIEVKSGASVFASIANANSDVGILRSLVTTTLVLIQF